MAIKPLSYCALVPAALVVFATFAQPAHVDMKEGWQFKPGDDIGWAQTMPPEAKPISIAKPWEEAGYPEQDGFGWYFTRVSLPKEVRDHDVLLLKLGQIDDADETYVNGRLVGSMGGMGVDQTSAWQEQRSYTLPRELLRDDNFIAVRVNDYGRFGGMLKGQPEIVAYNVETLPARSALLDPGTAVFLPSEADPARLPASIALVKDIRDSDFSKPAPAQWQLRPTFRRQLDQIEAVIAVDLAKVDLYGGGEVAGPLLRDNTDIVLWNTDNYMYRKAGGKRLYQSHPWVMGVRNDGSAFGVLFDSTWKAELDLRGQIRFSSHGPAFPVVVFERSSPAEIMKALADYTGKMAMPPLWALGFQQCKYSYFPDAKVRQIAEGFRSRQLPCDVIWFDIDYMDGFRIFTIDKAKFPDPVGINGYLHDHGFKSVWMIDPGVKRDPGYSVFDTGTQNNAWVKSAEGSPFAGEVWPGACVFPDYTSPPVRAWWSALYKDFLAQGIDGIWNDMNEPAVFDGPDLSMPEDNQHAGGGGLPAGPHLQYHNVYGMLMVRATREGMMAARPDTRPFVLTRSNFLGGHRYAATWTGDNFASWEQFKVSVPMSVTLGLSGQPFNGPDIGGFSNRKEGMDPELWRHWFAAGVFYPFARAHYDKGTPYDKEPWAFGPESEQVARVALQRRYRLMPYLYTLFHEAAETGVPVMRPIFFADTKDLALRDEQDAFMLGGDLIVQPRWGKDVNLPKGDWAKLTLLEGNVEGDAYQPTLLQRPGSIIPMGPVVQSTANYNLSELTLLIHLDGNGTAEGVLYEDAYDGYGYQKGEFALTRFKAKREGDKVVVEQVREAGNQPQLQRQIRGIVTGKVGTAVEVR